MSIYFWRGLCIKFSLFQFAKFTAFWLFKNEGISKKYKKKLKTSKFEKISQILLKISLIIKNFTNFTKNFTNYMPKN